MMQTTSHKARKNFVEKIESKSTTNYMRMKDNKNSSAKLLIKKKTSCFIDETEKVIASNCRAINNSRGANKKNESLQKKQRFKKSLSNSSFLKNYFEFESNDHDRLTTFKVNESLDGCNQLNIVREDKLIVNNSSQNSNGKNQITNESNQDVNQPCYIDYYQNNIMIEHLLMLFNDYFILENNSTTLNQEFEEFFQ